MVFGIIKILVQFFHLAPIEAEMGRADWSGKRVMVLVFCRFKILNFL